MTTRSKDLSNDAGGSMKAMEEECSTPAAPREGERGEKGSARIWLAGGDRGVRALVRRGAAALVVLSLRCVRSCDSMISSGEPYLAEPFSPRSPSRGAAGVEHSSSMAFIEPPTSFGRSFELVVIELHFCDLVLLRDLHQRPTKLAHAPCVSMGAFSPKTLRCWT